MEPREQEPIKPVSRSLLLASALILLVGVAVLCHHVLPGGVGNAVVLGIAGLQAALVVVYSMGMRHEKGFHRIVFGGALLFLAFFIVLTLSDVLTRGDVAKIEDGNYSIKSPVRTNAAPGAHRHGPDSRE